MPSLPLLLLLHVLPLAAPPGEPVRVRRVVVGRRRAAAEKDSPRRKVGGLWLAVAGGGAVRVTVDGVERGLADPELRVEPLVPGLHDVALAGAGRPLRTEAVFVAEGAPTRVEVDAPAAQQPSTLPVSVRFSAPHLAYYSVPTHQWYGPATAGPLFERMRAASGVACHHLRVKSHPDRRDLYGFMRPGMAERSPWNPYVTQLVAGCFNFFQANDVRPDLDFQLVQRLYPGTRRDCFSVGFMQPYWMHAVLGCERLSMVDLDWRIHDGHQQLLGQLRAGRLKEGPGFDAALSEVSLDWSARFDGKPPAPSVPATVERLCLPATGDCRAALLQFQRRAAEVRSVELQVSALHDAEYAFLPGALPVLFFSNALESIYTTRPQFDLLMAKLSRGLPVGGKAVLLYHAAGRQQFGVYELTAKGDGAYALATVCRDEYLSSPIPGLKVVPYTTWFEQVVQARGPVPRCSGHPLLSGAE